MSNHETNLFFSGDEYFSNLLLALASARKQIWIESYIFDLDPIGLRVLKALSEAAQRGVDVRLLVDGIGSFNWIERLQQVCASSEMKFRVYHPLPFGFAKRLSWRNLRRWLLFFRRANKRNHRKIILIDHHQIFIGSFNISQVHTVEFLAEKAWRDTGAQLTFHDPHSDFKVLERSFLATWTRSQENANSSFPKFWRRRRIRAKWSQVPRMFRLNSNFWWRYLFVRDLKRRLKRAQSEILITTAYFIPRLSLIRQLRRAARRGTHVALLLPKNTDVWFVRQASLSLYRRLVKDGVRVYEYQPSVLHAKTMLIDDWGAVGSCNLNHRSLLHDLEIEVELSTPTVLQLLKSQWQKDLTNSREITLAEIETWSLFERMLSRILWWFRYWL